MEDEPTQSYSQEQIDKMRSHAEFEPECRPEDFLAFGDAGTPQGMVGSRNAACFLVVGSSEEGIWIERGDPAREAELEGAAEAGAEPSDDVVGTGTWQPPPGPISGELGALEEGEVQGRDWPLTGVESAASAAEIDEEGARYERQLRRRRAASLIIPLAALFAGVLAFTRPEGGAEEGAEGEAVPRRCRRGSR